MAIGLAGGIGQALVAGATQFNQTSKEERDRKRKESIENEARDRVQTMFQQEQDKRSGEAEANAGRLDEIQAPLDPFWNVDQHIKQTEKALLGPKDQAPVPTGNPVGTPTVPQEASFNGPPAPAVPNPNPAAGPVVTPPTQGLGKIQMPGSSPVPQGAPASQNPDTPDSPDWHPEDTMAAEAHKKYQNLQTRVKQAVSRMEVAAGGDPDKLMRMKSAYFQTLKPEFDKLQGDIESYGNKHLNRIMKEKAVVAMDAYFSGDPARAEAQFGKGSQITNVDGIRALRLPTGQTVPLQAPNVWALFKRDLATMEEVTKAYQEDARNVVSLTNKQTGKEATLGAAELRAQAQKILVSMRSSQPSGAVKTIEWKAAAARASWLRLHPGDDDGAEQQYFNVVNSGALDAQTRATKSEVGAENAKQALTLRKVGLMAGKVIRDSQGNTIRHTPKQAYDSYLELAKDSPEAAGMFRAMFNKDDEKFAQNQDGTAVATPAPKRTGNPLAKPTGDRKQFRDKATGAMVWHKLVNGQWVKE